MQKRNPPLCVPPSREGAQGELIVVVAKRVRRYSRSSSVSGFEITGQRYVKIFNNVLPARFFVCPFLKTSPRPGLSLSGYGRAGQRRLRRLYLVFHGQRCQWRALVFRRDVARSQQRVPPLLRFSVALPLGINGAARQSKDGWNYPKRQPLPYFNLTLRSDAREHRVRPVRLSFKRLAASGDCNELRRVAVRRVGWRRTARLKEPQKPDQKQSPKHRPDCRVRPVAHPPERQSRWATRPAT